MTGEPPSELGYDHCRPIYSAPVISGKFVKLNGTSGTVRIMLLVIDSYEATESPLTLTATTLATILDPQGKLNGASVNLELVIAQVVDDSRVGSFTLSHYVISWLKVEPSLSLNRIL